MTTGRNYINESTLIGSKSHLVNSINPEAKSLIDEFQRDFRARLSDEKFTINYKSIDDILELKYHKTDIEKIKEPDYSKKTEFLPDGVRGNLQKAKGNVLSYDEADEIISGAEEEELP